MQIKRSREGMRMLKQRRELLITQAELGAAIGKTSAWVSLVELGKHKPSAADIEKMERFFAYATSDEVVTP